MNLREPHPAPTRRPLGRLVVAAVAIVTMVGTLLALEVSPASAESSPATMESEFLTKLNRTRNENGLPSLTFDAAAAGVARSWSGVMSSESNLYHNPNLVRDVEAHVTKQWQRLGENVGYGWSVDSLHQAFWDSPGHRANMLGEFNRVGIGVVRSDRIWVTFVFLKAPGVPAQAVCSASGWVLDGWGAVHSFGNAAKLSTTGYWTGWNIARDLSLTPDRTKGFKLDGFGGLWPVGSASKIRVKAYWHGWDIARGVAVTSDAKGAYVLDAFGGIHEAGNAPKLRPSGYWLGWAIARDINLDPTDDGRGYVLDGFGGLWPIGDMPKARLGRYLGRDLAVSFSFLADGTGGYVVDRSGGVHPFAVGNHPMPATLGSAVAPGGIGLHLGSQPAVISSNGSQSGVSGTCGSAARWPTGLGRATVSR